MRVTLLPHDSVPNFCWDRHLTVAEIQEQLRSSTGFEWVRVASWILREAAYADVWTFLTPQEIRDHLDELRPFLGRRRELWDYIIRMWHELGKL